MGLELGGAVPAHHSAHDMVQPLAPPGPALVTHLPHDHAQRVHIACLAKGPLSMACVGSACWGSNSMVRDVVGSVMCDALHVTMPITHTSPALLKALLKRGQVGSTEGTAKAVRGLAGVSESVLPWGVPAQHAILLTL